jgi:autophagy-related protein 9
LNELFSPFITPYVLLFHLRPKSQEIVDFFRNFTVSVIGVGDVCSFAQMDVRKHGNPDWQVTSSCGKDQFTPTVETNQYTQGEHGKTELSLIHFAFTNPKWKMPVEAKQFVKGIRKHAIQDLNKGKTNLEGFVNNTAMGQSLMSVGSLGDEYSSIVQSVLQVNNLSNSMYQPYPFQQPNQNFNAAPQQAEPSGTSNFPSNTFDFERILQQNLTDGSTTTPMRSQFLPNIDENENSSEDEDEGAAAASQNLGRSMRGSICKREGPIEGSRRGLLRSLMPQTDNVFSPEFTTADMCLSTLLLHEIHYKQVSTDRE